jgi:hypothetical protein
VRFGSAKAKLDHDDDHADNHPDDDKERAGQGIEIHVSTL